MIHVVCPMARLWIGKEGHILMGNIRFQQRQTGVLLQYGGNKTRLLSLNFVVSGREACSLEAFSSRGNSVNEFKTDISDRCLDYGLSDPSTAYGSNRLS